MNGSINLKQRLATATIVVGLLTMLSLVMAGSLNAQISSAPSKPPVALPQPPFPVQLKKTIVFLESDCLQDFNSQAGESTPDQFAQMSLSQQVLIAQQLSAAIIRLKTVKLSASKLTPEELAHLSNRNISTSGAENGLPAEIVWRLQALKKMINLTNEEFTKLTIDELDKFPSYQVRGTGFLIGLVDPRINKEQGDQGLRSFRYLITNRHVAQPGIERGRPCKILRSSVMMNRKADGNHSNTYSELDRIDQAISWTVPKDTSVDLAATPFNFPVDLYDHYVIPTTQFITEDDLQKNLVVEGDPVMFAGLFVQTFDQVHTLEPIVRSGTLAMIPTESIPTPLEQKLGHVLLADAHVFGGNSGSPMFVDTNKFVNGIGWSYKLLGVISGEVFENSDLSMNVTTTIAGGVAANSDVSIIVPATEIIELLNDPKLSGPRDEYIAHQPPATTAH